MLGALQDMARAIVRWRDWWTMGMQDIALRYRRSMFGPFWISAGLVALVFALAYVYSQIFRTDYQEYLFWLATGQLAWLLILLLVNEACGAVLEHGVYFSNLPMPVTMAAGRIVLRNGIIYLHNLVAIVLILYFFGLRFDWVALQSFAGMGAILFAGYCAVLILGPICARFRDITQAVVSLMQVVFFLTPIMWMPEHAGGRPMFVLGNPIYHLIETVRAPLLGHPATALNWQVTLGVCAGAFVLACVSQAATRKRVSLWV